KTPKGKRHYSSLGKRGPSFQRKSFVGALEYQHLRRPQDAVDQILERCLRHRLGKSFVTETDLRTFFEGHGVERKQFVKDCGTFGFMERKAGDRIHTVLRLAGYEGNIDDFWLSVFGKRKPSVPTAFIAAPEVRKKYGVRPWWVRRGVKMIHSGQTRKPG